MTAYSSLSPMQQLVEAIISQTRGNPGGAPTAELRAAMLTGAFYESTFNPAAQEADPSPGQPNAISYGAYSMRTSNVPGIVGGMLDTLINEGYSRQAAIMIAQNPWESTQKMLPAYEAAVKQVNWQQGAAMGAAQAAAVAEQPSQPYGTAEAQLHQVPVSEVVNANYAQYIVPLEGGKVMPGSPTGLGPPPPGTLPPPSQSKAGSTAPTKTLPGLGGLLQQLDSWLNPARPSTTLYSSKPPPKGVPEWLWKFATGGAGGAAASSVQQGVGGTIGSVFQGVLFPLEVGGIRLVAALPGVIALLMAAASGLLGIAGTGTARKALTLVPGGNILSAAGKAEKKTSEKKTTEE